jgi:hypothetical protein
MRFFCFSCALVALMLASQGCDSSSVETAGESGGSGGGTAKGGGVGEPCTGADLCRKGLECKAGVCELGHSTPAGQPCTIGGECQDGLQCAAGVCATAGDGESGASCTSDLDCKSGFRCVLSGFSAQCQPEGTTDVGGDCTTSSDCYAGLGCTLGKCSVPGPGAPTFGVSTWPGVNCEAASTGEVDAYFEIPKVADPAAQTGDFFRLPFPNDVLVENGKIDLTGFPTPGSELLGFDPVQVYVDALAKGGEWGTYSTVYFRFSGEIDFDSFKKTVAGVYPIQWIDITQGTPEYGSSAGESFLYSPNDTHYICRNWVAIRRPPGAPMVPGHVYVVYLSSAGRDAAGNPIKASPELQALLLPAAPADPVLAKAHAAFQPLRDYMADKLIKPSDILNATVITAGTVRDPMKALAQTVQALPPPSAKGWVKCAQGVASPCPDATGSRACADGTAEYDEYHALISLPIFQQGSAPYVDAGGDVRTDQPERTEDVCMALTVPKGATMPAGGWPLVVYAHGTGGSFRSHVRPEIAGALSSVTTPNGTVSFAVLGIDQVEHGPRRGGSTASPNDLFYNFKNPAAARGNPLQGAVDQLSLARFAAALDVDAATSGGDAIKIDPAAIVFYGHSQGSTEGSVALPYSDVYKGAVLSGNGASLIDALLNKTQPVNIAGAIPFVLADIDPNDGSLNGKEMHPALSLLQSYIDPADPLNHARAIGFQPETGHAPKHVFQTYGLADHYSPGPTMAAFALAAGLALATSDSSVTTPDPIGTLVEKALPISGNVDVSGTPVTLVVREYAAPSGVDGHFVATDAAAAGADLGRFLGMAAAGELPIVGP